MIAENTRASMEGCKSLDTVMNTIIPRNCAQNPAIQVHLVQKALGSKRQSTYESTPQLSLTILNLPTTQVLNSKDDQYHQASDSGVG